MSTTGKLYDLDAALARLAAEAGPSEALSARVLADAAMVTAERQPPARAPERKSGGWFGRGRTSRPVWGMAGAFATLALSLGLGLGYGFKNDREVLRTIDETVLSEFSPLDEMESEVIAAVGDDVFGLDSPL